MVLQQHVYRREVGLQVVGDYSTPYSYPRDLACDADGAHGERVKDDGVAELVEGGALVSFRFRS